MSSNKQPGKVVAIDEPIFPPPDQRITIPRFEDFLIEGLIFRDIRHLPLARRVFFENRVAEALNDLNPFLKCVPEKLREPNLSETEILRRGQNTGLSDIELMRLISEDDLTTTVREPREVKDVIFQVIDRSTGTLVGVFVLFYMRIRANVPTELVVSAMTQLAPIRALGVPFWGKRHSLSYAIFVSKVWDYILNNTFSFPNSSKITRFQNIRMPKRLMDNIYDSDSFEMRADRGGKDKTSRLLGDEIKGLNFTERVVRLSDGEYYVMEKIPESRSAPIREVVVGSTGGSR